MDDDLARAEVLNEEMARSLVPAIWSYYIRVESPADAPDTIYALKAESIHGAIIVSSDGSFSAKDPEGNALSNEEAKSLVAALQRDMLAKGMLENGELQAEILQEIEELKAAQSPDGYRRSVVDWLNDAGPVPYYVMLMTMIVGVSFPVIGVAVVLDQVAVGLGLVSSSGQVAGAVYNWTMIPGLLAYADYIFDILDPWVSLGSCSTVSCELSPLFESMM